MDDTVRARIVQKANELFNLKGYRTVTLNDLSSRLGMSKKTFYQYFTGKEEIAEAVLEEVMSQVAAKIAEAGSKKGNPLDILRETLAAIRGEVTRLNPLFLEDVQKYIPHLWQRVEQFRAKQVMALEQLLRKARTAGVVRPIDPRLATVIFLECVQSFVRPDFASKHGFTIGEVMDALFDMFLDGIVEPKPGNVTGRKER